MKTVFSPILLVLSFGIAQAQPAPPLDAGRALTQFVLRTYGLEEGLPQLTANAVVQTPDGYLWVGTDDGLARFDGTTFEVFEPGNTPAFAANATVKTLHVDAEGVLWIGTQGGGVVRYVEGDFVSDAEERGLAGRHVSKIIEDGRGRL